MSQFMGVQSNVVGMCNFFYIVLISLSTLLFNSGYFILDL